MTDASKLISLLYVSHSLVRGAAEVRDIVAASRGRNSRHGITGALVFTGGRFAQILEGGDDAVDLLMRDIANDPRHKDVAIIARRPIHTRDFKRWTLAYWSENYTSIPGHGRGTTIYQAILEAQVDHGEMLQAAIRGIAF